MRIDETYFRDMDTSDETVQPDISVNSQQYRFYIGICGKDTWTTYKQGAYRPLASILESLQFITEASPDPIFLNDSRRLEFEKPAKDDMPFLTEEYDPESRTPPCVAIGFDASPVLLTNPRRMYQFYKLVYTTLFSNATINSNFAILTFCDTKNRKSNSAGAVGTARENVHQKIKDMSLFSAYRIVRFISDEDTQRQYTDFVKFTYQAMGTRDATAQIFSRTYGPISNTIKYLNNWIVADSYIQIPFTPLISSKQMLKDSSEHRLVSYCGWPYLSPGSVKRYNDDVWMSDNYIKHVENTGDDNSSKLYIASNPQGTEVHFIIQRDGIFENPNRSKGFMNEFTVRLEISIMTHAPERRESLIKQTARFLKKDCKIKPTALEAFVSSVGNSDVFKNSEVVAAIINEMQSKK